MVTIVTRAGKGSPLTNTEVDANFTNLNSGKAESTNPSVTGNLTFTGTGNRITGDFSNATISNRVAFQSSTTNGATAIIALPNGTSTDSSFQSFNGTDLANGTRTTMSTSSTEGSFQVSRTGTGTYLPMTFYTGGSERIRVDTSGNVGIGGTSAGEKLEVVGGIETSAGASSFNRSGMIFDYQSGSSTGRIAVGPNAGGTLAFYTGSGSSVPERMRIDSSGNVGIGKTSPATKLEVAGSTDLSWQVTASISGTTMTVSAVTSGTIAVGDLVFGANVQPYTRVTALGTGTGGIGTYTVSVYQIVASATTYGTAQYGGTLIRITDTDVGENTGQPTGGLQFYTSDTSSPTAGVGAYVAGVSESITPDTALVFGTRDNSGGGIDANERVRIDSVGVLLVGYSSATATVAAATAITPRLQIHGASLSPASVGQYAWGGTNAYYTFNSSAGTFETYTAVTAGDALGIIQFNGADGTSFVGGAQIKSSAEGTISTGIVPGRLQFYTASPAGTLTERVRIDSDGDVGIGTTSPTAHLEVAGSTTETWTSTSSSISGTTLTVGGTITGTVAVGDLVLGANIQPYTRITALGTGTGGAGTYTVSVSQTAAAAATYGTTNYSGTLIRITDTDTSVRGGQPTGGLQFYTSDGSAPTAGVGAYVAAVAESTTPDTALVFGTRDNAGGGIDANERMRIDSSGNVLIGTTTPQTGAVLAVTGGIQGTIKSGTVVASTSGTSIDFTNIPSWVKRITVMLQGVSVTAGTSPFIIQLGTGATPTYTTTGYLGQSNNVASMTAMSTGFMFVANPAAANAYHGNITITNITSNTWVESGIVVPANAANNGAFSSGSIALGAVLTAVRITTENGTSAFDAGNINILYEG